MKSKRIGKFTLSLHLIENDPGAAHAVMCRCIVVRCEMMYATNTFYYIAVSDDFAEIAEGELIPEYFCVIKKLAVGSIATWLPCTPQ